MKYKNGTVELKPLFTPIKNSIKYGTKKLYEGYRSFIALCIYVITLFIFKNL